MNLSFERDESLHLKTHRHTEKMTYNPNFDFGAVYTNTLQATRCLRKKSRDENEVEVGGALRVFSLLSHKNISFRF